MSKRYLYTCFIRFDFGIYSRYSESFGICSLNEKKPKLKNNLYFIALTKFIKQEKEVAELFTKYGLSNWELEIEKKEILKINGIKPDILIFDEIKGQDFEVEALVKRI